MVKTLFSPLFWRTGASSTLLYRLNLSHRMKISCVNYVWRIWNVERHGSWLNAGGYGQFWWVWSKMPPIFPLLANWRLFNHYSTCLNLSYGMKQLRVNYIWRIWKVERHESWLNVGGYGQFWWVWSKMALFSLFWRPGPPSTTTLPV